MNLRGDWKLPALNVTMVVQEELEDKALGKEVRQLLLGFNLVAGKLLWAQLPEPVPLGEEVLGPVGDALVCREIEGQLVSSKACACTEVRISSSTDKASTNSSRRRLIGRRV